ncbi:endosomal peripheral membrane protein-like protein [Pseudovirgaria hyperparasitica]|uniref:Endosomal peripheral membrane protein-like protein n=1 Tax=Pseudovirgaria hyperparasitica TaxID=470096 RepID=A0A6A6WIN5_9PEZI|nr:endosomal peripheral membrane protein-like protein [Pseudovirgaria hyperparasitica]KAF2761974.1 endosomal peripheral membrane protein-like protein [Pseudovirgaria hyperparasitica]
MTAQLLTSELTNLIQDAKRKNPDLKNAAEKSLQELKSLHVTSEEQLTADLVRRPQFIEPFLIACGTHNSKFASPGAVCLQRLSVSRGIPKERLRDVLQALQQCISLSLDVQLKVLQTLPSLLANYSSELRGELLAATLTICSSLQAVKTPAVSSTAVATLQQLVSSVFDKVSDEDEKALEIPATVAVPIKDGSMPVRPAAHDAYSIFHDLCLIAEGNQPKYVRFSVVNQASGLELLETILSNHGSIFLSHPEQGHLLCVLVMPLVYRCLNEGLSFQITVRAFRILHVLLRQHLSILSTVSEEALISVVRMLDESMPSWKRALALELFRSILSDQFLIVAIYSTYDQVEGRSDIIRDSLSSFVRMSTEKPSLIGLGQQSSAPYISTERSQEDHAEQAAMEAGAIGGMIGSPSVSTNNTGISVQWSTLRTACIDYLDKAEPPPLPETYLYSLVLTCINNLSESLARFILPLTVHMETKSRKKSRAQGVVDEEAPLADDADISIKSKRRVSRTQSFRKKTVPVNPLSLGKHNALPRVKSIADLVETCWPAVLATCSTFLNASLDNDYYRALVRSFQKFTQVAGLLRLATPRDALLTTLGKNAVPANVLTAGVISPKTGQSDGSGMSIGTRGLLSVDSIVSQASSLSFDRVRRGSVDVSAPQPSLNARNLLCLRALLNLAIALGPTLETAWSIVFETLQQADLILAASSGKGDSRDHRSTQGSGPLPNIAETSIQDVSTEATAVQAAASRLFESTVDFPNEAFITVVQALCRQLRAIPRSFLPGGPTPGQKPSHPRRVGSVTGITLNTDSGAQEYVFALGKIGDLAAMNLHRLTHYSASESGWDILVEELNLITKNHSIPPKARRMSADIVGQIGQDMAKLSMSEELDVRKHVQSTFLDALLSQISSLYQDRDIIKSDDIDDVTMDIHDIALQALRSMLEQCGESLTTGWGSVFAILRSVFIYTGSQSSQVAVEDHIDSEEGYELSSPRKPPTNVYQTSSTISRRLARSAFDSVQLICSDFLINIPTEVATVLLELILKFTSQDQDLNMSLTTITFLWNVSDNLNHKTQKIDLEDMSSTRTNELELAQLISERARDGSVSALWLLVLVQLSAVSIDQRIEVRNGAIQTILRIFENTGDELLPNGWRLCLHAVLFRLVTSNLIIQESLSATDSTLHIERMRAWDETSGVVLSVVSNLFASNLDLIMQVETVDDIWQVLIGLWRRYLAIGSHSLSTSTYTAIGSILSKVHDRDAIGSRASQLVSSLLINNFPEEIRVMETADSNQEAYNAYAKTFGEVYRLVSADLSLDIVRQALRNFRRLAEQSIAAPYSSDVEYPTSLQKSMIECLSNVDSELAGVPSALLTLYSDLIMLPYRKAKGEIAPKGPTYVALSKAAMKLSVRVTLRHVAFDEIYTSGAISKVLDSFALAISQKYKWKLEGKTSTTWQTATKSALTVLESILDHLRETPLDLDIMRLIWGKVVIIAEHIAHADLAAASPTSPLVADEEFDISSLENLQRLIIPSLGSSKTLEASRRAYTSSLFRSSLIHATEAGEIPDLDGGPLQGLYTIRFGRTYDPHPSPRTKMSLFCLSELIALVTAKDGSAEHVKLAQAAAPYLILRAALPIKRYIADQPLRGKMPQPESQRQELLFVLQAMKDLESEPKAIPDAEGISSTTKKHLHRLFPLVTKAIIVAERDAEILRALTDLLEVVSDGFGM